MDAGKLDKRIEIQSGGLTTDSFGQEIEGAPVTVAKVWAALWQLSTKDVTRQAGLKEQAEAKFLIRHMQANARMFDKFGA